MVGFVSAMLADSPALPAAEIALIRAAHVVAARLGLDPVDVIAPGRARRTRAQARAFQLALYIAQTSGGAPLCRLAEASWMDRKDLRAEMKRVEEARSSAAFDEFVEQMEAEYAQLN